MSLEFIFIAILVSSLLALSVIDARSFILPNYLTLPLIGVGLVASYVMDKSMLYHGLGAGLGYGVLVGIEKAYLSFRGKAGLGRGDAKLLAAGGAWCGALSLPFILLAASLSALLYALSLHMLRQKTIEGSTMIAFGPFLSFGIILIYGLQELGLMHLIGL